jgi:sugar transferase (PEP-CTERM/EpsH1 system associated)
MSATGPLVVQLVHSLQPGGLERLALELALRLPARGYRTAVCCIGEAGWLAATAAKGGVPVLSLDAAPGFHASTIGRLADALQRLQADVLHTHNRGPLLYGTLAARRAGIRGLVHTRHGFDTPPASLKWRIAESLCARRAGHYVAVSNTLTDCVARAFWLPPDRVTVIHNGVDTEVFKPAAARGTGLHIGHVGRLVELKNHAGLLRAFAVVHQAFREATLTLVGDGPLMKPCRHLARSLGIADAVRFAGAQQNVAGFLQQWHVFALPSFSEGISLSLLEAMACECACVATAVGGTPEIVKDAHNGLLLPPHDDQALAEALTRLACDPLMRNRLGRAARQTVCDGFSVDAMVSAYDKLYRQCLR